MGEVQRNRGIVVIPHRMTGINQVVQGYLDPIPGIGPEDQGLISATSAFVFFQLCKGDEQQTLRVMIPIAVIGDVRLDRRQLELPHHRAPGRGQRLGHRRGMALAQGEQVLLRAAVCPQNSP